MGCFKAVLGKLKKDVQKKMGNMPTFNTNDDKFERMYEESNSKKSSDQLVIPDWVEEIAVPMDFSLGGGKIVFDKKEIEEIKKNRNRRPRRRFESYEIPPDALKHGPYLTQKYYHKTIARDAAEKLLLDKLTEGCWLLRNSNRRPNTLIISYLYMARVNHKYIAGVQYLDPASKKHIYVATIDDELAFYDVHSLIEFHRLNQGPGLKCMLGESVKNSSQRDSSPPRVGHNPSPRQSKLPKLIKLKQSSPGQSVPETGASSKSPKSPKSPSTLKQLLTKSFEKSKRVLRPKKLPMESSSTEPSTSQIVPQLTVAVIHSEPQAPAQDSPPQTESSQEPQAEAVSAEVPSSEIQPPTGESISDLPSSSDKPNV